MEIATINYSEEELIMLFDEITKRHIPQNKKPDDITGGYIQSLINGSEVILFFGYDKSRNKVSARFKISQKEALMWYLTLESKIAYLRKKKSNKQDASGEMMNALAKLTKNKTDPDNIDDKWTDL